MFVLTQDRIQWQPFVNLIINLWVLWKHGASWPAV